MMPVRQICRCRFAYQLIVVIFVTWYILQVIQSTLLASHDQQGTVIEDDYFKDYGEDLIIRKSNRRNPRRKKYINDELQDWSVGKTVHRRKKSREADEVFIQTNISTRIIAKKYHHKEINSPHLQWNHPYNDKLRRNYEDIVLPFEQNGYQWDKGGPGEMGEGVILPEANDIFRLHQFNLLISNKIAVNRSLPDVRPPRCKLYKYPEALPSTSIIIAFHNEARSTLLRTIHSAIHRSPPHLLQEIILVNDASTLGEWHQSWLEEYVSTLDIPIHLIQSKERLGLVGARLLGFGEISEKSEVITFLDSHCECTEGWLEPLLERISKDSMKVVSPVIDAIDEHTFEYVPSLGWPSIGGFSWFPEFMWISVPPKEKKRVWGDPSLPLRTPTIAGGVFAINKNFFHSVGLYDPGLKIWGSENLELSFKVWQCGGSINTIPCSRVGHIFRSKTPYSFQGNPEKIFLRNNRRVLETWTDNYKDLFYAMTPKYRDVEYGNISSQRQQRLAMGCKSFQWYLDNVYPGNILPRNFTHLGKVKNKGSGLCLDVLASGDGRKIGSRVSAITCSPGGLNQIFTLNHYDQLRHDRYCLTPQSKDNYVTLERCALGRTTNAYRQEWIYNTKFQMLQSVKTKQCLTLAQSTMTKDKDFIMTQNCTKSENQMWSLHNITLPHGWR